MQKYPPLKCSSRNREKLINRDFKRYQGLRLEPLILVATILLVVGFVAHTTIRSDYLGQLQLSVGASGVQLQIEKRSE